ncbi:MAG TPA: hypothetical protein VH575_27955 [Gemmataceae bacterium]
MPWWVGASGIAGGVVSLAVVLLRSAPLWLAAVSTAYVLAFALVLALPRALSRWPRPVRDRPVPSAPEEADVVAEVVPAPPPRIPTPEWLSDLMDVPASTREPAREPPQPTERGPKKTTSSLSIDGKTTAKLAPGNASPAAARPDNPLLLRTTCPHCWHSFSPENVLWVSTHSDLLGDPRLGPEQQQRFLPTRFNLNGNALDAHGVPCMSLACPHCHLVVPRGLLEMEPFFASILGAPGCGKSYLLAAMTWQLRQVLPRDFAVTFRDADLSANSLLNEYEKSLFLNAQSDNLVPLGDLIRKTELQGQLYDTVLFGNQAISYPRPFLFTLSPTDQHPNAGFRQRLSRLLCLYDNAGEHFQPGMDSNSSQATRHLAQSRLLLFLFDPTQDQRFRERCRGNDTDLPAAGTVNSRQEVILLEAADRIRRLTNLPQSAKHPHPLIVLVTKYDTWAHLLGKLLTENPWKATSRGITALDVEWIAECSRNVRQLLGETCPELVNAADGFSRHVVYLPVSALGRKPLVDPATGRLAVRPRKLNPIWALVPLLYGISQSLKGVIPVLRQPTVGARGLAGGKGMTAAITRERGK